MVLRAVKLVIQAALLLQVLQTPISINGLEVENFENTKLTPEDAPATVGPANIPDSADKDIEQQEERGFFDWITGKDDDTSAPPATGTTATTAPSSGDTASSGEYATTTPIPGTAARPSTSSLMSKFGSVMDDFTTSKDSSGSVDETATGAGSSATSESASAGSEETATPTKKPTTKKTKKPTIVAAAASGSSASASGSEEATKKPTTKKTKKPVVAAAASGSSASASGSEEATKKPTTKKTKKPVVAAAASGSSASASGSEAVTTAKTKKPTTKKTKKPVVAASGSSDDASGSSLDALLGSAASGSSLDDLLGSSAGSGSSLDDLLGGGSGSDDLSGLLGSSSGLGGLGGSGSGVLSFEDFMKEFGSMFGSGSSAINLFGDPTVPQNNTVEDDDILLSELYGGGEHGDAFSDIKNIKFQQMVLNITVRGNERVDSVGLMVMNNDAVGNLVHGGKGGTEQFIEVEMGDTINELEVHWDKNKGKTCIFYLSLTTSSGKTLSTGTKTDNVGILKAPEGYQLGGYYGRASSDGIFQIGAIWTKSAATDLAVTDIIDDGTTDMGKTLTKQEKALEYSNLGLFILSVFDPTGIAWMASDVDEKTSMYNTLHQMRLAMVQTRAVSLATIDVQKKLRTKYSNDLCKAQDAIKTLENTKKEAAISMKKMTKEQVCVDSDVFDSFSKQLVAAETVLPELKTRLKKANAIISAEQTNIKIIREWKEVLTAFQEDVRLSAALEIQATWRMFIAKQERLFLAQLRHDKASVILIQRVYRGFRDRIYMKRIKIRSSLTDRVAALVDRFIISGNFWGFVLEVDADYRRFMHKIKEEETDASTFMSTVLRQRKLDEDQMMQDWFTASTLQNPLVNGIDQVTKTYSSEQGNSNGSSVSQAMLQSGFVGDLIALSPNKRKDEVFPADFPPNVIRHAMAKGFSVDEVIAVMYVIRVLLSW
ncbi:hypothetical protein PRIC2_012959 [Phytophthora ramorum]